MPLSDCQYPWKWAVISSNGKVRPCCFSTLAVGNLQEDDLAAIWNGEVMQGLRRDILANRINPVCQGAACKFVQMADGGDDQSGSVDVA